MKVGGKETAKPEDVATMIKALLKDYNQKEEHTLERNHRLSLYF